MKLEWETFPVLRRPGIIHGFSRRAPVAREALPDLLLPSLQDLGLPAASAVQAEQVHGNGVAIVDQSHAGTMVGGVDALVTNVTGLPLVVRVADCGPVYFHDPVKKVIALAHSGRKGTEQNISGQVIAQMVSAFHCDPATIVVQLGPCIRPPHYEIPFAEEIGKQVRAAGVHDYHDCGTCTATDLDSYYSYRAEKGTTGRMWAVLMLA